MLVDPYYTALPGSPVSYAYYGRHPVLRIPIIVLRVAKPPALLR